MQIGMIGLGKMGGNMSRRLMQAGHGCVVYARTAKTREALAKDGAIAASSVADVVKRLDAGPRAIWPVTSSSTAATPSTRMTSGTRRRWPIGAFTTWTAARPAASGASTAATA
jgi:6-phosphogluconate dehydrogenase (decarboxylating)